MYINTGSFPTAGFGGPGPFLARSYVEITEKTDNKCTFIWHYPDVEGLNLPEDGYEFHYYEKTYTAEYIDGSWKLNKIIMNFDWSDVKNDRRLIAAVIFLLRNVNVMRVQLGLLKYGIRSLHILMFPALRPIIPSDPIIEQYKQVKAIRNEHNAIVLSNTELKNAYKSAKSVYEQNQSQKILQIPQTPQKPNLFKH